MTAASLAATELRLYRRHGIIASLAVATTLWSALLVLLPPGPSRELTPWILFLDVAAVGFFFVPALILVERANGVASAHALTPGGPQQLLGVRMVGIVTVTLLAGVVVVAVGGASSPVMTLLGLLTTSVFFSALSVVMIGRSDNLAAYVGRIPIVAPPLLAPALLDSLELMQSPWLQISPVTAGLQLLRGAGSPGDLAWMVVAAAILWSWAARVGANTGPEPSTRPRLRARPGPVIRDHLPAWRSQARVDQTTILGDRLIVTILAGVPVLALGVRALGTHGATWVEERFGFELVPQLPLLWAFVLVVHIPMMLGAVAGLVFLEDRDAGVLPALVTTRASLSGLLRYRLGLVAAVTLVAVASGFVLAGASHSLGLAGVLVTATLSGISAVPVTLALASLARDRVQGMAVMKAIGLPIYLPLVWWLVDHPAAYALASIPSAWPVRLAWATSYPEAATLVLGGLGVAMTWSIVGVLRLRGSLT